MGCDLEEHKDQEAGGTEMRVCMVVHHYPPRYQAGVELITRRAVRWLKRERHEVEVVCVESIDTGRPGLECTPDIYEDTTVHRLAFDAKQLQDPFRASYHNPIIGRWIEEHLRRTRPDLVHVQSCYLVSTSPIEVACKLNLPVVLSLHDYWAICPWMTLRRPNGICCSGAVTAADCAWCLMTEKRRYRLPDQISSGALGRLVKRVGSLSGLRGWRRRVADLEDRRRTVMKAISQVDQLTVSSRFLQERVHTLYGIPAERLTLVSYGLDLSGWQRLPKMATDGVLRIGYIGQISPPKGVHVLIDAFNRLRASSRWPHLSVYGDLTARPRYVRTLRKLARGNPDIVFEGRFDNARVAEVLQQVDVLVVASQWYETGPLVTWEAFASGTPVVATDLPNMKYQVKHEVDGLLFAPDDSRDLARQLQRLLDAPGLLKELASNIRPVKSHEDEMHEILEVYRRALQVSGDGGSA